MSCHRVASFLAVFSILGSAVIASAQPPIDELAIFETFVDTAWTGRFQDVRAPQVDHVIEWSAILDGQAVRWSKRVDALGFSMETTFYWDRERAAVAFVQLGNNGVHGHGTAWLEDNLLVVVGVSRQASGSVAFRQTFEILADGSLEDRYYRKSQEVWAPQHVVVYHRSSESAGNESS